MEADGESPRWSRRDVQLFRRPVSAGATGDVIALGFFQIGKAVPTTPWEMITNATLVTKIVLALLAMLSLLSWAVMLGKWFEFRRVRKAADAFMRSFDRAQS